MLGLHFEQLGIGSPHAKELFVGAAFGGAWQLTTSATLFSHISPLRAEGMHSVGMIEKLDKPWKIRIYHG